MQPNYLETSHGEQDTPLRNVEAGAYHSFQVSLITVIAKTSYFSSRYHLNAQHHISTFNYIDNTIVSLKCRQPLKLHHK